MDRKQISTKVLAIISEASGETVTDETIVIADSGIDSLSLVEAIMQIEEQLKVTIPDEDAAGFKTIGSIVDYVAARVK